MRETVEHIRISVYGDRVPRPRLRAVGVHVPNRLVSHENGRTFITLKARALRELLLTIEDTARYAPFDGGSGMYVDDVTWSITPAEPGTWRLELTGGHSTATSYTVMLEPAVVLILHSAVWDTPNLNAEAAAQAPR